MVFKPKIRVISIRLSEEDYTFLHHASLENGARSVSDYTRDTLFRVLRAPATPADALAARLDQLASDLRTLRRSVRELQLALQHAPEH